MAIFNWMFKGLRWTRKKFIIDIPPMPKEQRDALILNIENFISKTISDSIAKTASNEISKAR